MENKNNLMFKEKFDFVLRDDETILWTGDVNTKSYVLKVLRTMLLLGLIPFVGWVPLIISIITFPISLPLIIYFIKRNAKNTFLCVTNKRVIKRNGIFKTDMSEIPYSAVRAVNLKTSIFDSEEGVRTADIIIQTNIISQYGQQASSNYRLKIISLNNVDEAYKLVSKHASMNDINVRKAI